MTKKLNDEAIKLIYFMLGEEESDVELKLIAKGTLKEKNIYYCERDDDISWKLERIKVLKYILKKLKGDSE
jgi:hypothetical protein